MNATLPTLSVIVPNYNHAKYLPTCLGAIFKQSVQPLEVIVIDDASTDNSMEVLREFQKSQPSLRILQNETNQKVVFGMNRGLKEARGEYVFFVGADDEIRPGLIEKSLRLLAQHPKAALSCTIAEWYFEDSKLQNLRWCMGAGMADQATYLSPDDLVAVGKRGQLIICTSSAVMKKEALLEVGGFKPELKWHCDWFATFVPAFRHGLCYIPEVLSIFNVRSQSYFQSGHRKAEHRDVLLKLLGHLSSPPYADVRQRVRDSGALSLFAWPMLKLVVARTEYRYFLTATLVKRTLKRVAELAGKKVLPRWAADWVLKRFYRAG